MRVSGPDPGADHCWVFAEIALLHDGNRAGGEWRRKIKAAMDRLKQIRLKRSASLLVVVAASRGDVVTEWADDLEGCAVRNQPALTDLLVLTCRPLGTVVLKTYDIKARPGSHAHPNRLLNRDPAAANMFRRDAGRFASVARA